VDAAPLEFLAVPPQGRIFTAGRRVRLGDVTPRGRLRLDATVRYLQDVSHDDTEDANYADKDGWVVRRTALRITKFPVFQERLTLRTLIEASAVWVHVDLQTMRPATLAEDFLVTAREAAMDRKVSARSMLRMKPEDSEQRDAWPVRFSDMDALGHMNNAAYWEAVEEWLSGHRDFREPFAVVLEHLTPIEPGHDVFTVTREEKNITAIWHEMNGTIAAVAQLQKL